MENQVYWPVTGRKGDDVTPVEKIKRVGVEGQGGGRSLVCLDSEQTVIMGPVWCVCLSPLTSNGRKCVLPPKACVFYSSGSRGVHLGQRTVEPRRTVPALS